MKFQHCVLSTYPGLPMLQSSLLPEIVRTRPGVPGLARATSHPEILLKRVLCWSDSLKFGRNLDFRSGRGAWTLAGLAGWLEMISSFTLGSFRVSSSCVEAFSSFVSIIELKLVSLNGFSDSTTRFGLGSGTSFGFSSDS